MILLDSESIELKSLCLAWTPSRRFGANGNVIESENSYQWKAIKMCQYQSSVRCACIESIKICHALNAPLKRRIKRRVNCIDR